MLMLLELMVRSVLILVLVVGLLYVAALLLHAMGRIYVRVEKRREQRDAYDRMHELLRRRKELHENAEFFKNVEGCRNDFS